MINLLFLNRFIISVFVFKLSMNTISLLDDLTDYVNDISQSSDSFFDTLSKIQYDDIETSLKQKAIHYFTIKHESFEKTKKLYESFSLSLNNLCSKYIQDLTDNKNEDEGYFKEFEASINKIKEELNQKFDSIKCCSTTFHTEPSFVLKNSKEIPDLTVDLVQKYPGSYIYQEFMSDRRTGNGSIYIDHDEENMNFILKYMKNDKTFNDDIHDLDKDSKNRILNDLEWFGMPIKKDFVSNLCLTKDEVIMDAWRNRKAIMINGKNMQQFNLMLKKYKLFDNVFNNQLLKNIQYYNDNNVFYINFSLKQFEAIDEYLSNNQTIINEHTAKQLMIDNNMKEFISELKYFGIDVDSKKQHAISLISKEKVLTDSKIITTKQYDAFLREWMACDVKWKTIYRASEHDYTAKSFHEFCDNVKGPTLIIIQSTEGWIFGGFTNQSWDGCIFCVLLLQVI